MHITFSSLRSGCLDEKLVKILRCGSRYFSLPYFQRKLTPFEGRIGLLLCLDNRLKFQGPLCFVRSGYVVVTTTLRSTAG